MASFGLPTRSGPPPYPNVMTIPTPPLQRTAIALVFLFPSLSAIFVGMRLYIRISKRQQGLDDWLCLMALVFSLLMTGPLFMYTKLNYWGWRADDVPSDFDSTAGFWWNFLVQMFYNPVLALVKASILFFLLRLGGHKTSVRYAIYALNIVNAGHAIAIFFTALLQCLPMAANWDLSLRSDPDTKCISNWFHVIASCLTILTDFLVLLLPFWIFLSLKMPWAAKIAVIGVFLMGSVVAIVGIIRVVWVYNLLIKGPEPGQDTFHDISLVYSVVEVNLAILSASIPALRPLFRHWFPKLFGGSSGKSAGLAYGYSHSTGTRGAHTLQSNTRNGTGDVPLKSMASRTHHTEIGGASPNGSEEEILTYNGILRTTHVDIAYESASKHSVSEPRTSSDFKDGSGPSVRNKDLYY